MDTYAFVLITVFMILFLFGIFSACLFNED